jgi:hypothetical protein
MNEVKIYGSDEDYAEIEAACRDAGIECQRRQMMYRAADMSEHDVLVIAFLTATSIQAVSKAVMAVARAYESKHKKKVCYTDGHGVHYFQNYKPEELVKVLPKTTAIYFGEAAPEDHPDDHRDDESVA